MVRLAGLEPTTYGLGIHRSILLSYRRINTSPGFRLRLCPLTLPKVYQLTFSLPSISQRRKKRRVPRCTLRHIEPKVPNHRSTYCPPRTGHTKLLTTSLLSSEVWPLPRSTFHPTLGLVASVEDDQ